LPAAISARWATVSKGREDREDREITVCCKGAITDPAKFLATIE